MIVVEAHFTQASSILNQSSIKGFVTKTKINLKKKSILVLDESISTIVFGHETLVPFWASNIGCHTGAFACGFIPRVNIIYTS